MTISEAPLAFMIKAKVELILKKEKEKASLSTIRTDLKPPYEVAAKPHPVGYVVSQFHKFNGRRGHTRACRAVPRFHGNLCQQSNAVLTRVSQV